MRYKKKKEIAKAIEKLLWETPHEPIGFTSGRDWDLINTEPDIIAFISAMNTQGRDAWKSEINRMKFDPKYGIAGNASYTRIIKVLPDWERWGQVIRNQSKSDN